jgi:sporulation protein YqfD
MAFLETLTVTVTSADIPSLLNLLQTKCIVSSSVTRVDALTVSLEIGRKQLPQLEEICSRRGDDLRVKGRKGALLSFKRILRRPVLTLGILLLLFLTLFLPTRVLFVRVEGNTTLPARQIVEKASLCGIAFGASRREVRSEQMKNALLEAMPELQWAGVNTRGCVATITVRERPVQDIDTEENSVSSIVALRDGIVQELTVTKGSAACKVGQAVKAGQVLISGYTDCGLTIQASHAEGEVFALTRRSLTVIASNECLKRCGSGRESKKYALIIGKNRINFYKGSGISDTSCVKMYSENYVTLPGGFVLPVALVTEVVTETSCEGACVPVSEEMLSVFAQSYLKTCMRSGRILSGKETLTESGGNLIMEGSYQCLEMVGVRKQEEIVKPNE